MFKKLFASALFAGAGAGLVAALVQLLFVQPVLIEAERYESGELVHFAGGEAAPHDHADPAQHADGQAHDHGDEAHGDGGDALLPREAMNVVFNIALYVGFGLVLTAAMALGAGQGVTITARSGVIWGIAGFVALHLAPAFSLAPEVPGVAAADVGARQIWWFATVAAAAVALWLIAFGRGWAAYGAAVVLLLAPHLIGAPHHGAPIGPVPPEVAALFASRALGAALAAWATLGLLAGFFWNSGDSASA